MSPLGAKWEFYTIGVVNANSAYYELLKHVIFILGMLICKLINNWVITNTLACKLVKKFSINVIIANRKIVSTYGSSYHCILDHGISLLILMCLNMLGSDTATASRPATHRPENCEWIGFTYLTSNLFLNCFISCFIYFELSRSHPKCMILLL